MKPHQNPHFTMHLQPAICILALLILAFFTYPTNAQPRVQATMQTVGCDPYSNLKMARLSTLQDSKPQQLLKENVYTGCPSNNPTCAMTLRVQPKQHLLVFNQYKQYTCVLSINPEQSGWIPTNRLKTSSAPARKVTYLQWQGWWRDLAQLRSIEIQPAKSGQLSVIGNGTYQGHYLDSKGAAHLEPYHRNFGFITQMNNNPFIYQSKPDKSSSETVTPQARNIEFLLIGDYLVVNDRLDLGGNVNFSAIYQKERSGTTNQKTRL